MADEALNDLWNRFTLTPDERVTLTVVPGLVRQPEQHLDLCLVARLLISKMLTVLDLRDFLRRVSNCGRILEFSKSAKQNT